ncbi:MAG: type VI secretion protein IcmF/TssM N-terminal domain-containing protein, partial [Longimicrobiales bacterium]
MSMKQKEKAWIFGAVVLVLFLVLGLLLPLMLDSESTARVWIMRGGLWFLGLIAALLLFLVIRNREEPVPANTQDRDEIDVAIAAARVRLTNAKGKSGAQFGRQPLLLVAGPSAAAKTTVVARSGLQPDLLAGELMRGDAVAPTTGINVWYAQGHLFVEAGGRVTNDAAQWRKLIRYIQPRRLGAVLSRGRQAPRAAVICLGCDELLKPGASEAVPAHAQKLRARLAEVSHEIGIRLPVYVIFTKTDRLPYFEDFVRSLTRDEARDVLGATLTVPPVGNVGHYADRESRRIAHAFQSLFHGLALRRIDVLPRETQETVKSGTYEFPREFRKITDLASLFLLELCRPSQLGVSPFLRGFYFTGVRPVLVHDVAAPTPMVQPRGAAPGAPVDATS